MVNSNVIIFGIGIGDRVNQTEMELLKTGGNENSECYFLKEYEDLKNDNYQDMLTSLSCNFNLTVQNNLKQLFL